MTRPDLGTGVPGLDVYLVAEPTYQPQPPPAQSVDGGLRSLPRDGVGDSGAVVGDLDGEAVTGRLMAISALPVACWIAFVATSLTARVRCAMRSGLSPARCATCVMVCRSRARSFRW
jgi:hypothetical protein